MPFVFAMTKDITSLLDEIKPSEQKHCFFLIDFHVLVARTSRESQNFDVLVART